MSSSIRPVKVTSQTNTIGETKEIAVKELDYDYKRNELFAKIQALIPKGITGLNKVKTYHKSGPINTYYTNLAAQLTAYQGSLEKPATEVAKEHAALNVIKVMKDFIATDAVGDKKELQDKFQPILDSTEVLRKLLSDLRLAYQDEYKKLHQQFAQESKKVQDSQVKIAELNAVVDVERRRSMSAPNPPPPVISNNNGTLRHGGTTTASISRMTMGGMGLSYQNLPQKMRESISPADANESKSPALTHLSDLLCMIRQDSKESRKAGVAVGQARAKAINALVNFVKTDAVTEADKKVAASLVLEWIVGNIMIKTTLNTFLQHEGISANMRGALAEIMVNAKNDKAEAPAFESNQDVLTALFVLGQAFYLKNFETFKATVTSNDVAAQRAIQDKVNRYTVKYKDCFDYFPSEFINSADELDSSKTIADRLMKIYKTADKVFYSAKENVISNGNTNKDPLRNTIAPK